LLFGVLFALLLGLGLGVSGGISVGERETTVGDAEDREEFAADDGVCIPSGANNAPCPGEI
jgi:hypothetical protein